LRVPAALPASVGAPSAVSLHELDETAWTRYDAETCTALARQVIEQVRQTLPLMDAETAQRRLPSVPEGVSLDDLELETRTRNSLAEEGYEEDLEALQRVTIGHLLEIPGFGARCLVDLLTSLEDFDISVVRYPWASRRFAQILAYEVDNLLANPSVSLVHRHDPRFEQPLAGVQALLPGRMKHVTLRDLAEAVRDQAADLPRPVELLNALQDVRIRLDSVVSMRLEDELLDVTARGDISERNRAALYRRMGWDGAGKRTLQAVADELGVTRESIRKICNRQLAELQHTRPFTPTLTRALTLIVKNAPAPADETERLLQKDGLSRERFNLESLLSAAEALGWESGVTVKTVDGQRYALLTGQSGMPEFVLDVTAEAVTHWGMANVGDVAAKVAAGLGITVETRFVVQVLERAPGLHWLDAPGGWFWLSTVRHNRLLTQIRKIMSVSPRLEVGDLRRGIARHHRMLGFAPPPDVLLELCRQQPLYDIEGTTVLLRGDADRRSVLGEAENLMVEVLERHGGVMGVEEFQDECQMLGLKEGTFFTYLDYSPLFTKHRRGVYGLRGSGAPKDDGPPRRGRGDRRRVLIGCGQGADGRVWLHYELSRAAVVGGIVGVPAALSEGLQGDYQLYGADGSRVGSLRINRGLAWRLGPFLRRADVRPGDHIRLEIDPVTRTAVALKTDEGTVPADADSGTPQAEIATGEEKEETR
jgi:hypothetical protein